MLDRTECTLDADINNCKFYRKSDKACLSENSKCAFQYRELDVKPNGYVRQERWYEKYYKK